MSDRDLETRIRSKLQELSRRGARGLPWLAALITLGAAVLVLVLQLSKNDGAADSTTLGLFAMVLVLTFGVVAPRQTVAALRRISSFKVAGIEVGMQEAQRAERVTPLRGEDDGVDVGPAPKHATYADVVDQMKSRLRFVRLILGLKNEVRERDYVKIADSLDRRHLLSRDEYRFVLDLVEGNDPGLAGWPAGVREQFLESGWAFATRFGPLMWDRFVRRRLKEDGWFVADFVQERGHRPDFLAYRDGAWALIAARIGGAEKRPYFYKTTAGRLKSFQEAGPIANRFILIPEIREARISNDHQRRNDQPDGVEVVQIHTLAKHWRDSLFSEAA